MTAAAKEPIKYNLYTPDDLKKSWLISWQVDGKRIRLYGDINKGKTRSERLALIHKLLEDLKSGKVSKESRSIGKDLKYYKQTKHGLVIPNSVCAYKIKAIIKDNTGYWRKKTCERHTTTINKLLEFANGQVIDKPLIAEFFRMLKRERHSTTHNNYRSSLRTLLREAGWVDLIKDIPKLRDESSPARYFQAYQAKRLKNLIEEEDPDLSLFIEFIYFCFMRPGELRGLRAGDILFGENKIRVPREISKTRKTQYVAIPENFLPRLEFINRLDHDDLVFPNPKDRSKKLPKNQMYNRHVKFLKKLDLYGKGYMLYSWKHSGAIALSKKGIPPKEIMIQMRHHSLNQTDQYLRQLGVMDLDNLRKSFPVVWDC